MNALEESIDPDNLIMHLIIHMKILINHPHAGVLIVS
jgi:hypothetical protein